MDVGNLGQLLGGSVKFPGSPDSNLSDVSFPSHVSGFESFADFEETLNTDGVETDGDSQNFRQIDYQLNILSKASASNNMSVSKDGGNNTMLNEFLKMSSPPISASASASQSNSLNESSLSLIKLEGDSKDSFLNSQQDDVEKEERLRKFLEQPHLSGDSKATTPSLSQIIDSARNKELCAVDSLKRTQTQTRTIVEERESASSNEKELNQTELDALFMKEVRQRLHLSSVDSTKNSTLLDVGASKRSSPSISTSDEIDETIREIEEETQLDEDNGFHADLLRQLSENILPSMEHRNSIDEVFDRDCIENIQRPHLDGSSDDDLQQPQISNAAANFARSGLHTRATSTSLQRQIQHLNMNNIPERQLAEGSDNEEDSFNDGGGGGDGSSGHSDNDGGGNDGGVAIRNIARIVPTVGLEREISEDGRSTPPSRERPVGGSGQSDGIVRPQRQVQFVTPQQQQQQQQQQSSITSQNQTPTNQSSATASDTLTPNQDGTPNNQDSRLSARYFLAASTPFKPADQTNPATWMSPTSFHVTDGVETQRTDERTLVGEDVTLATPSTATLSRLKHTAGDVSNWTFASQIESPSSAVKKKKSLDNSVSVRRKSSLNGQPLENTFTAGQDMHLSNTAKRYCYNPFDACDDENQTDMDFSLGGFEFDGSAHSDGFQTSKQDFQGLLAEDEKIVAMNNNSIYKPVEESNISEFSMHSENQRITSVLLPPRKSLVEVHCNEKKDGSESGAEDDDGRVSVYFRAKSNEMGRLSGEEGPRPQFSDDSHLVITPPAGNPFSLLKPTGSIEHTIPRDAIEASKTFVVAATPDLNSSVQSNKVETPKSSLLATHKRLSTTVLKKSDPQKKSSGAASKKVKLNLSKASQNESNLQGDEDAKTLRFDDSTNDYQFNNSVYIPVSEEEADSLLGDIKQGRVSSAGMNEKQQYKLAQCISSMTGYDVNLVFKLIQLLPANPGMKDLSSLTHLSSDKCVNNDSKMPTSSTSMATKERKFRDSDQFSGMSTPMKTECAQQPHYVKSPVTSNNGQLTSAGGQPGKPISSVIPLSKGYGVESYHRSTENLNGHESYSGQNVPPNSVCRLQSTRLAERFSDPHPVNHPRLNEERLAVSVSPVCYNENFTTLGATKHSAIRNCFPSSGQSTFHPLPPYSNSYDQSSNQFHSLNNIRSTSQPELTYIGANRSDSSTRHVSKSSSYNHSHNSGTVSDSFSQYSKVISFSSTVTFDVCCVGMHDCKIVPVHNSSHSWMQCKFGVVFFAYNGREADFRQMGVFSFPPKITLEPHSTEEMKIKFLTHQAGTYMIKIEVLTTPILSDDTTTSVRWYRLSTMLNMEAVAEAADVEVLLNDKVAALDFGELTYGSYCVKELQILNKGRADVPIRLCIAQGSTSCKYFNFDLKEDLTSSSSSYIHPSSSSTSLSASSSSLILNKLSVLLKGRKEIGQAIRPVTIPIRFEAPVKKLTVDSSRQLDNSSSLSPDNLYCQLDIETETKPVQSIQSITLKAMVGVARLHSLRTMQAITLSSTEGESTSRSIPLKNAGNITLNLEATIQGGASNFFTVQPSVVSIRPGEESEVKLSFKSNTPTHVESRLLVTVLPNGEQYDWQLHGTCTSAKTTSTVQPAKPVLLCNKLSLNWAGIQIGTSSQQKLILRNDSESKYIHLTMSIAGDHPNFQIHNDYLLTHKNNNKYEAVIKPQAELPVHVLYTPTFFNSVSSSLIFRTTDGQTKFIVPLCGYGGCSNLDINGAKKLNEKFWIDMGEVCLGKSKVIDVMLRNSGTRPAFVTMKCFSDITAKLEYPSSHVNIAPNNFILADKTSCHVKLIYQPLHEAALKLREGAYTAAHLVIYSGDEVLRKEYKRNKTVERSSSHLDLLNTNFTNEHIEDDQIHFNTGLDWENFFNRNISKNVIAMVTTPTYNSTKIEEIWSEKKLKDVAPIIPDANTNTIPDSSGNPLEYWSVYPEQLILDSSEDALPTKLYLSNHTDLDAKFEFIWPAQTLVITPCKDKIPARSKLTVRINAKPSFLSRKEELPWRGSVYIQCNGEEKCMQVQIRDTFGIDEKPKPQIVPNFQKLQHPQQQQQHPQQQQQQQQQLHHVPHVKETRNNQQQQRQSVSINSSVDNINIYPQLLEFKSTKINMVAELSFTIMNQTDSTCHWFLSSIAPPYLKSIVGNGEIHRASYAAFKFAKHSGKLNPKQCFKLPVSFLPRDGGIYSQFWDFETSYDHNPTPKKFRIELIGEGCSSVSVSEVSRKQIVGTAKPMVINTEKRENKSTSDAPVVVEKKVKQRSGHVFIKDDVLQFPATKLGEKSEMKFRLCNDSQEPQKVRVSSFRSPFSVISKHTKLSIRPKSYIRVPVYYSPSSLNEQHDGLLVLTPETGENLCVKLIGKPV